MSFPLIAIPLLLQGRYQIDVFFLARTVCRSRVAYTSIYLVNSHERGYARYKSRTADSSVLRSRALPISRLFYHLFPFSFSLSLIYILFPIQPRCMAYHFDSFTLSAHSCLAAPRDAPLFSPSINLSAARRMYGLSSIGNNPSRTLFHANAGLR